MDRFKCVEKEHFKAIAPEKPQFSKPVLNHVDGPFLLRELTKEEVSRQRYRNFHNDFPHLGVRYGPKLSFLLNLFPEAKSYFYNNIHPALNRYVRSYNDRATESTVFKYLKSWTNYFKIDDTLSPEIIYPLSYLEMFGGYFGGVAEDYFDEIVDWTTTLKPHTIYGSKNKWLNKFRMCFRKFLSEKSFKPSLSKGSTVVDYLSFDEWVANPWNWGRSGSVSDKSSNIWKTGTEQKNKWTYALSKDPKEISKLAKTYSAQHNVVSIKQELAKGRPIVASDIITYLRMSYLNAYIDPLLMGDKRLTMYGVNDDEQVLYARMIVETNDTNSVKIPLDYEKFDHQPMCEEILIIMDELQSFFNRSNMSETEDINTMFDILTKNFKNKDIWIRVGKRQVQYKKGILSGWRWTSMLDSLCNIVWAMIAEDVYCSTFDVTNVIDDIAVMGDDAHIVTCNRHFSEWLVSFLNECGLAINRSKFNISNTRAEYLRKFTDIRLENKICGYPARILPSLFFQKPALNIMVKVDSPMGLTANWTTFKVRCLGIVTTKKQEELLSEKINKHMFNDLNKFTGFSKRKLIEWYNTPTYIGGAGYGHIGRMSMKQYEVTDPIKYPQLSGYYHSYLSQFMEGRNLSRFFASINPTVEMVKQLRTNYYLEKYNKELWAYDYRLVTQSMVQKNDVLTDLYIVFPHLPDLPLAVLEQMRMIEFNDMPFSRWKAKYLQKNTRATKNYIKEFVLRQKSISLYGADIMNVDWVNYLNKHYFANVLNKINLQKNNTLETGLNNLYCNDVAKDSLLSACSAYCRFMY